MNFITRYRLDLWAILVLVILNLSLLGFFWYEHFRKPPPPPRETREDSGDPLARELHLDRAQADSAGILRAEHFRRTDPIRVTMVRLNGRMMDELFASSSDTQLVRLLSDSIGMQQAEFDRQVYGYFAAVKALLRPEQYDNLQRLIQEALRKKLPGAANPGNPPPQSNTLDATDRATAPPNDNPPNGARDDEARNDRAPADDTARRNPEPDQLRPGAPPRDPNNPPPPRNGDRRPPPPNDRPREDRQPPG